MYKRTIIAVTVFGAVAWLLVVYLYTRSDDHHESHGLAVVIAVVAAVATLSDVQLVLAARRPTPTWVAGTEWTVRADVPSITQPAHAPGEIPTVPFVTRWPRPPVPLPGQSAGAPAASERPRVRGSARPVQMGSAQPERLTVEQPRASLPPVDPYWRAFDDVTETAFGPRDDDPEEG